MGGALITHRRIKILESKIKVGLGELLAALDLTITPNDSNKRFDANPG